MDLNKLPPPTDNLNYGIIGNCKSSALINEDSSIEWCCLPQFDSPSVFGKFWIKKKGVHLKFYVITAIVLLKNTWITHVF